CLRATAAAPALLRRAGHELFHARKVRRQGLAPRMLAPWFSGRGWRLPLALGLDLGTADARLQLQQLQLRVGELFAARTILRNPLLTQSLFQHPDLQLRVLQTLLRRTQLPFQLFDDLGVGSRR